MRALYINNLDNNSNANGNNNLNNNAMFLRIIQTFKVYIMGTLYQKLYSYENLLLAFQKARKGKTKKHYVIKFENNLKSNLLQLQIELMLFSYRPKPLTTFILRDPKTRKINRSDFRDRVVHHALCYLIESLFEKSFIHDSYANRKGKGVLKAINRFDIFKRKVSKNNTRKCYVLKCDIKQFFENVNHNILLNLLEKRISDRHILHIVKIILANYQAKQNGKGMPLGNLTSQFFANVYLDKLDQYIKHKLRIKHYIRYVDDFVVLDSSKERLKEYKLQIDLFLKNTLGLELHSEKSRIISLEKGVCFLGLRIFYYHKLLGRKNLKRFKSNLDSFIKKENGDYDSFYDFLEGWLAYAQNANTFNLRKTFLRSIHVAFPYHLSSKEIDMFLQNQHKI